jgi:hypothetical protein
VNELFFREMGMYSNGMLSAWEAAAATAAAMSVREVVAMRASAGAVRNQREASCNAIDFKARCDIVSTPS